MENSRGYYVYIMFFVIQGSFLVHSFEENITDKSINIKEYLKFSSLGEEIASATTEMYSVTEEEEEDEWDSCGAVALDPEEYTMFPNGSVVVEVYNKTYDPATYRLDEDIIIVCPPSFENNNGDNGQKYKFDYSFVLITRIGLGISMLCLFLHLIVFFTVSDMRNLPGYNLASLSFSLFFGYLFFLVGHVEGVYTSGILCICVAAGIHFFMLSSFLWMSAMAFDVFRSLLKAVGKLRLASTEFRRKKYFIYCVYSWGTSLLFVIATLILDNVEGVPVQFKPIFGTEEVCWFRGKTPLAIFFAAPVIIVIIFNVIFFGVSVYIICSNRMKAHGDEAYKSMLKRNALMHGRLATIMGLSWFTGIIATLFDTIWLYYIYTLINTLQGIFIFLGFTCTEKVKKHIIVRLESRKRKQSITPPTFQSYYNTGLSLGDDIDFNSETNIVKMSKIGRT